MVKGQYTKIFDFGKAPNGNSPRGELVSDGTFLYGMTNSGGMNLKGVIFKIKADGTAYSMLHEFGSGTELLAVLETVKKCVENGELDTQIEAASAAVRERFAH